MGAKPMMGGEGEGMVLYPDELRDTAEDWLTSPQARQYAGYDFEEWRRVVIAEGGLGAVRWPDGSTLYPRAALDGLRDKTQHGATKRKKDTATP